MLLNGYPAIYLPTHHRAYSNGMVYEHILEAEKKLGRMLLDEEVVHHIDHNRENNDFNNLLVFASQEDHGRFHSTDENLNILILQENGSCICPIAVCPNIKSSHRCDICGKRTNFAHRYCMDCIKKYHPYSEHKLEREELKSLIRTTPFTTIAINCGVTDNAVRKWCDTYHLPRTKREINTYSDEEWNKL